MDNQKNICISISIITVCRNSEKYISETIESVIGQTYRNIQYIVIDGKSTDNTNSIIRKYKDSINIFISESDNGMYDAINKGLKLATGEYILILNSDDQLNRPDTIENLAHIFSKKNYDYYYGNIIKCKVDKCKKVKLFNVNYKWLLYSNHSTFVPHPCLFISRKLNEQLGGYNLKYRYASDFDYILRMLQISDASGKHIDLFVSRFRIHDQSISASGKITPERIEILKQNGYYEIPWTFRKLVYYLIWIYYKVINIGNSYRQM